MSEMRSGVKAMLLSPVVVAANLGANAVRVPSDCVLQVEGRKDRDQLISDLPEALLLTSVHERTFGRPDHTRQQCPCDATAIEHERICRGMLHVLGI